jgi:hypothetical protein
MKTNIHLALMSLSSSWNERTVSHQSCGENKNTHFMFRNFIPKIVQFMK